MKVHSAGIHGGQSMQENVSGVQACDLVAGQERSLQAGVMCAAAF